MVRSTHTQSQNKLWNFQMETNYSSKEKLANDANKGYCYYKHVKRIDCSLVCVLYYLYQPLNINNNFLRNKV